MKTKINTPKTYNVQGYEIEQETLIKAAKHCICERLTQDYKCISSPKDAKDYLHILIGDYDHEVFYALWMDSQHNIIEHGILFNGSINSSAVYPREVVKAGLACNAASVIFAHNHPSGSTEPSNSDIELTKDLKTALKIFEIRMLDHMIIGESVTSLSERGVF